MGSVHICHIPVTSWPLPWPVRVVVRLDVGAPLVLLEDLRGLASHLVSRDVGVEELLRGVEAVNATVADGVEMDRLKAAGGVGWPTGDGRVCTLVCT